MKNVLPLITALAIITTTTLRAELPILKGDEWLGYFLATKSRKCLFAMTRNSDSVFHPIDRDGDPIRAGNPVNVSFHVVETTPDGKFTRKELDLPSLTATSEPVIDPKEPITFSAKVTGNASFESTIKVQDVGFTASGKINDPGELKGKLHFGIDIDFAPYKNVDMIDKDDIEKFEDMSRRDKLEIVTIEGEKKKYKIDDSVDFSKEFPHGISSLTLESARYEDVEFTLTASKGSAIHFLVKNETPVYKALKLHWKANDGDKSASESLTMTGE
jgi:hypothetical protein